MKKTKNFNLYQTSNLKKAGIDFEERKQQEFEMLQKDFDQLKMRERENFNKIIFMERDNDSLKEENRKLKKVSQKLEFRNQKFISL